MKPRPKGFLIAGPLGDNTEQFDYVRELQQYLWRFVRVALPDANGNLTDYIDKAIEKLEQERKEQEEDRDIDDDSLACVLGYDGPIY